jgi:hypothetical protein
MKNQKLYPDELKVQSFVTSFYKELDQTREIHGGETYNQNSNHATCDSELQHVIASKPKTEGFQAKEL